MISKSLLSSLLISGFFSQASLATNIEEVESKEKRNPLQRTLNMSDLGDLQVIPPEIWRNHVNPYLPLNKGLGYNVNDSILTVSKPFYYLVTGYWPDEKGVVDRPFPNVVIIPPIFWGIKNFRGFCRSYTPENIFPFHWRSLLDRVHDLPDTFWPYLPGTNVHTVNLLGNQIGPEGARDFAQSLKGTDVHTVNLSDNRIGDEGARDFGESLQRTNVHTVDLSDNRIGDEGARDFGESLQGTNVHTVYLFGNFINPETLQFLSETYPHITWKF